MFYLVVDTKMPCRQYFQNTPLKKFGESKLRPGKLLDGFRFTLDRFHRGYGYGGCKHKII